MVILLKQLFGVRAFRGTDWALRRIVGRGAFKQISQLCTDRRHLAEISAKECGMTEPQMMIKVSMKLRLPFLPRVLPMELDILQRGLTLSDLRRSGSILITHQGCVTGIVCVDPKLALPLWEYIGRPLIYLAPWLSIAQALDKSERACAPPRERIDERRDTELYESAYRAVGIVLMEVSSFGAKEVDLLFTKDVVKYSFQVPGRGAASGHINSAIKASLLEIFKSDREYPVSLFKVTEGLYTDAIGARIIKPGSHIRLEWPVQSELRRELVDSKDETNIYAETGHFRKEERVVLVVDDNPTFVRVLERFFERSRLSVIKANNGEEALQILNQPGAMVDLMVCDLHMPGINGFEVVRRVRSCTHITALPIVILTSDIEIDSKIKALSHGADAVVFKNEDPRLLCVQVERLLSLRTRLAAA